MTRAKIVARFTLAELNSCRDMAYSEGYRAAQELHVREVAELKAQRERLNIAQTDAVTKLIEACNANLSKAGYLIGKLNKDNSR